MNNTLYTQLSPLGFAEWLAKLTGDEPSDNKFNELDSEPIDSWARTILNSLAFRWLREEKGIYAYVMPYRDHAADNNDPMESICIVFSNTRSFSKHYPKHEIAEHEALNKAFEILSCSPDKQGEQNKGGDDE